MTASTTKGDTDKQDAGRLTLAATLIGAVAAYWLVQMFIALLPPSYFVPEARDVLLPLVHFAIAGLLLWWARALRAGTLPPQARQAWTPLGIAFLLYALFWGFYAIMSIIWIGLYVVIALLLVTGLGLAATVLLGKASRSLVETT